MLWMVVRIASLKRFEHESTRAVQLTIHYGSWYRHGSDTNLVALKTSSQKKLHFSKLGKIMCLYLIRCLWSQIPWLTMLSLFFIWIKSKAQIMKILVNLLENFPTNLFLAFCSWSWFIKVIDANYARIGYQYIHQIFLWVTDKFLGAKTIDFLMINAEQKLQISWICCWQ